jgi:hypothetical protein
LKTLADGGSNEVDRLTYAVRRCLSREPAQTELEVLHEFLKKQTDRFAKTGADPWPLLVDDR